MKVFKYLGLILAVIALDQAVKLLVHFNMPLGDLGELKVLGDWFKLHYVLNPGMAFGLDIDFLPSGKLILTLFRLIAGGLLVYYIIYLHKKKAHPGFIRCMALVCAGAIGNVIDSVFYGYFFGLTVDGASTPWFHGKVVDMFYFDIWKGILPNWVPVLGGEFYAFWPIFNIADASIFIGISLILIFQKRFFGKKKIKITNE